MSYFIEESKESGLMHPTRQFWYLITGVAALSSAISATEGPFVRSGKCSLFGIVGCARSRSQTHGLIRNRNTGHPCRFKGQTCTLHACSKMAERANGGADGDDADSGGSDEYEYVTLTSAEVLEKLEEVSDTQIQSSLDGMWGVG